MNKKQPELCKCGLVKEGLGYHKCAKPMENKQDNNPAPEYPPFSINHDNFVKSVETIFPENKQRHWCSKECDCQDKQEDWRIGFNHIFSKKASCWLECSEFEDMEKELFIFISHQIEKSYDKGKQEALKNTCPPHSLIDYNYVGTWAGSMPPPNKKCTKCLLELRF